MPDRTCRNRNKSTGRFQKRASSRTVRSCFVPAGSRPKVVYSRWPNWKGASPNDYAVLIWNDPPLYGRVPGWYALDLHPTKALANDQVQSEAMSGTPAAEFRVVRLRDLRAGKVPPRPSWAER